MLSISERNRKVAELRWRNVQNKAQVHINSIPKQKYRIYKARLMGYLAGDGGVYIRKEGKNTHHEILFYPDDEKMMQAYLDAIYTLYQKKPEILPDHKYYRVRLNWKPACLDLLAQGSYKTMEWRIPFEFLNNRASQSEWLRAFFDCEAYVGKTQIQLQSVNKEGILQVATLLKRFDIDSQLCIYERKNPAWNTNYILSITGKENRRRYLNKIGFSHSRKLKKLKNILAAVA